jgi:hypothetical protein
MEDMTVVHAGGHVFIGVIMVTILIDTVIYIQEMSDFVYAQVIVMMIVVHCQNATEYVFICTNRVH